MKNKIISFALRGFSFHFSTTSFFDDSCDIKPRERNKKMKKRTLCVTILGISLIFSSVLMARERTASADSLVILARSAVDSGYVTWNKDEMLRGYALLERARILAPGDRYVEYYLSYAAYRLITYGMAMKQDKLYKEFVDAAEKPAEALSYNYPGWSEPIVLLAAIYGIEIAHNWMSSMTLGPKSGSLVEKALAIDSTNPRAYMILGINKFSTPAIFGGSIEKALEAFRKSISLFEAAPVELRSDLAPSWGYIDALTWLGLTYEKEDRYADALDTYRKTLQLDPDYARARYSLIPGVEKKIAEDKKK